MDLLMATRREITKKYAADYAKSSKNGKGLVLDELVAVTGSPGPTPVVHCPPRVAQGPCEIGGAEAAGTDLRLWPSPATVVILTSPDRLESYAVEETLGALTGLVRQGKVRYIGSSSYSGSQIVEAQVAAREGNLARFVTEKPPYSILVRGIEEDVLRPPSTMAWEPSPTVRWPAAGSPESGARTPRRTQGRQHGPPPAST